MKICPVCRKEIRRHGLYKETKFQETVAALSALQEVEVYNRYRERAKQYRQWKRSRGIKEVKVGEEIDVLDKENVWCVACVEARIVTEL